jgi:hypothetical protein
MVAKNNLRQQTIQPTKANTKGGIPLQDNDPWSVKPFLRTKRIVGSGL